MTLEQLNVTTRKEQPDYASLFSGNALQHCKSASWFRRIPLGPEGLLLVQNDFSFAKGIFSSWAKGQVCVRAIAHGETQLFCDNGSHVLQRSSGALRTHCSLDLTFLSARQHLIRECIELADTWCIRRPLLLVSRQSRTNRLQSDCSQANGFLSKRAHASAMLMSREWSLARLISANACAAARQARRPLWNPVGVLTSCKVVGGGPLSLVRSNSWDFFLRFFLCILLSQSSAAIPAPSKSISLRALK